MRALAAGPKCARASVVAQHRRAGFPGLPENVRPDFAQPMEKPGDGRRSEQLALRVTRLVQPRFGGGIDFDVRRHIPACGCDGDEDHRRSPPGEAERPGEYQRRAPIGGFARVWVTEVD